MSRRNRLKRRFRNRSNRRPKNRLPKSARPIVADGHEDLIEGVLKRGYMYLMPILHDSWCAFMAGRGECNCNPEVRLQRIPLPEEK
jgi:hypothetical protein